MKNTNFWKDIPEKYIVRWRDLFANSREGINLSEACPICGEKTLHLYYYLYKLKDKTINNQKFIGDGSSWSWCSSCGSYEHYSCAIPAWWNCNIKIDGNKLTHTPQAIENALKTMDKVD